MFITAELFIIYWLKTFKVIKRDQICAFYSKSLIAKFLIVLLTHLFGKEEKLYQFITCQSCYVDIMKHPYVLLDCILNATH